MNRKSKTVGEWQDSGAETCHSPALSYAQAIEMINAAWSLRCQRQDPGDRGDPSK